MTDIQTKNIAARDVIENALIVYDTPKEYTQIALAFIDGLKAGARRSGAQHTTAPPESDINVEKEG